MTAGILLLICKGYQHKYLVKNPQVTFFKTIYRRHTNFSIESIKQKFNEKPGFDKKSTCTIAPLGDLINQSFIVIKLPFITELPNRQFAWVKNLGYAILKDVYIQFDDKIIDRQYGEWLFIWSQLTEKRNIDKMIGNIPILYKPSKYKKSRNIYIPLKFWFCKNSTLSLPIIALRDTNIQINIKLRSFNECCNIYPDNSINVKNNVLPFKKGDRLVQKLGNNEIIGYYTGFDYLEKKMYYISGSEKKFKTPKKNTDEYIIKNDLGYQCELDITSDNFPKMIKNDIDIIDGYLYIDYIYLDKTERKKFIVSYHEYLIEQLQYIEKDINSGNSIDIKLPFEHPIKAIYWVIQLDNKVIKNGYHDWFDYENQKGENLCKYSKLILNNVPRIQESSGDYTNYVEPNKYHSVIPSKKINMLSFSLYPENIQPSGTLNMSTISNSILKIKLNMNADKYNRAKIRIYAINYNILKIHSNRCYLGFE